MITQEQQDLLADIFGNSERNDKIEISLDPVSRDIIVVYRDLDDEWFRELTEAEMRK